jgi:hypothetical protein
MAVGISIDFNAKRTGRYFARLRRRFPQETKAEIRRAADEAVVEIRRKMDGPVLVRRSGRLWRSVKRTSSGTGSSYQFTVGSNVPYGRYQELGFIHWISGRRVGPNVIWRDVWRWAEKRLDRRLRSLMGRLLR